MQTHVEHGLDIVERSEWLRDAAAVVGNHHEKCDIVREPLDVNQVIQEILALLHSELIIKQVTVDTELTDLLAVSGDRVQLQHVILKLVMNGCEAIGDLKTGFGRVVIQTTRDGDQAIKVAVRDYGNDLNENNLERMFQPFFTTKKHGMGMGLAINRTIIEAHGGRLWAENNPHGGAVFYFTLPVAARYQRQTEFVRSNALELAKK